MTTTQVKPALADLLQPQVLADYDHYMGDKVILETHSMFYEGLNEDGDLVTDLAVDPMDYDHKEVCKAVQELLGLNDKEMYQLSNGDCVWRDSYQISHGVVVTSSDPDLIKIIRKGIKHIIKNNADGKYEFMSKPKRDEWTLATTQLEDCSKWCKVYDNPYEPNILIISIKVEDDGDYEDYDQYIKEESALNELVAMDQAHLYLETINKEYTKMDSEFIRHTTSGYCMIEYDIKVTFS